VLLLACWDNHKYRCYLLEQLRREVRPGSFGKNVSAVVANTRVANIHKDGGLGLLFCYIQFDFPLLPTLSAVVHTAWSLYCTHLAFNILHLNLCLICSCFFYLEHPPLLHDFLLLFFLFLQYLGLNSGLTLAGQVLCHLTHAPSLFCFNYFWDGGWVFAWGWYWTTIFLSVATSVVFLILICHAEDRTQSLMFYHWARLPAQWFFCLFVCLFAFLVVLVFKPRTFHMLISTCCTLTYIPSSPVNFIFCFIFAIILWLQWGPGLWLSCGSIFP
jgi:hypothetical protein